MDRARLRASAPRRLDRAGPAGQGPQAPESSEQLRSSDLAQSPVQIPALPHADRRQTQITTIQARYGLQPDCYRVRGLCLPPISLLGEIRQHADLNIPAIARSYRRDLHRPEHNWDPSRWLD